MTKKFSVLLAAIAACGFSAQAKAATATFSPGAATAPSAEAVAAGVPAQTDVYDFKVTTDADILSVNNVLITLPGGVSLFQVAPPFGSNVEPPDPAFIGLNRALEADSWISTPGSTSLLGPDLPGDGTSTWGDLVDGGPQTNFTFARLAVPAGTQGTFAGRVSLNDGGNPQNFDFSFALGTVIPEPGSIALAAMSLLGLVGAARRRS